LTSGTFTGYTNLNRVTVLGCVDIVSGLDKYFYISIENSRRKERLRNI